MYLIFGQKVLRFPRMITLYVGNVFLIFSHIERIGDSHIDHYDLKVVVNIDDANQTD